MVKFIFDKHFFAGKLNCQPAVFIKYTIVFSRNRFTYWYAKVKIVEDLSKD